MTTPPPAQPRGFRSKLPMVGIIGVCTILLGASLYGIASMQDKKTTAQKDAAPTLTPARVPEVLLQRPIDPGSFTPSTKADTPAPAVKADAPTTAALPPPLAPTIEEIARANAAAEAWTRYYTTRAEMDKKRVEAISAGLTSSMTPKPTPGTTNAPGSAPVAASSTPSIGGREFGAGPQPGGFDDIWAAADSKQAWASSTTGNGPDYVPSVRHGPVSPYEIMAGTVLPAVTKGGMISDAPGRIVGQISRDVHCNTPSGGLCIPQGSTLILSYNNRVSNGETRLQVAAERLIFPDGTSMDLGRMVVADVSGYAGLEDEYQTHLGARLLNAALFTTIQGAFTLGSAALGANAVNGQAVESVASEETRAGLRIPPTLRIRPGFAFVVTLPKDLVFKAPYTFDDGTVGDDDSN